MTPATMIEKYIQLRNKVAAIKEQQANQLKPYNELMLRLETELLSHLNDNQLQSVNGEAGTAYKSVVTTVTVQDWPKTLQFIREHELWDLLEARVGKTAALEQVEETKKPIPGVVFGQAVVVRVRTSRD